MRDRGDSATGQAADPTDVAIVGLGLHLPGAEGPEAFWDLLAAGRSAIRRVPREELVANGEPAALVDRPDYVPFAADLARPWGLDAPFWGLSPKDAGVMDPQHRHFLEAAWEALEDAGVVPEAFAGRIGVFAGSGQAAWYHRHVLSNPDLVEGTGHFLLRHTGNDKDFLATRLSHALDLRGPSVNVQTACSTSLVATHMAARSLLLGECDLALAGGVTIELPHAVGYLFRENEILSPDGACHAFDHRAAGTVFGSGAAVAVLRRLDDALRDGDAIYAVLKGSAVNNDGARKAGYLAPSVDGQAEAIREALLVAGVEPGSVGYVECHGTGTALGDPIEVAALVEGYGRHAGRTLIGSVKTNIGHLDTAAGTASLAKAALALAHGQVPPSLGYEAPNPAIPFEEGPFRVADRLQPFPEGAPRAAVNSLGVGGTNAHVLLEAAPPRAPSEEPAFPFHPLLLSARTRGALDAATRNLAAHLRAHPEVPLADTAFTLKEGRRAFARRRVVVAATPGEAAALLEAGDPRRVFTHEAMDAPDVVFMLPGGGAQYPGMGRGLFDAEPVFRDGMERGLAHLESLAGEDPRAVLWPAPGREAWAAERMLVPSVQLPLLLILEHALAELWMSWGVRPAALIGHSMGENTAAALAGVMTFEEAIGLVHRRGTLFDSITGGGMVSVPLPEADLRERLGPDLDLAVVNGPQLSVASGPAAAVADLVARLAAEGIEAQPIPIAIAAHSRMLEPILPAFRDHLAGLGLRPPRIPILSNRTGRPLTDAEATDPDYWVGHLRNTVRFGDGLAALAAQSPRRIYLEVGPGRTLASLAGQSGAIRPDQAVGSLRHRDDPVADDLAFMGSLARVWACGGSLDWEQVWGGARRHRVRLPTYPWERADHYIAPGQPAAAPEAGPPARVDDVGAWGWAPRWTPAYAPGEAGGLAEAARESWLILEDETGLGAALAAELRAAGHPVVSVRPGDRFAWLSPEAALLPPERGREGWDRLLGGLAAEGRLPSRVLHLWLVTEGQRFRPGSSFFHRAQEQGFWSLLFLAQAWGEAAGDAPLRLVAAATGALQVAAEPLAHPEKATALGPLQMIPREMPGSEATLLDLGAAPRAERLRALLEEGLAAPHSAIAALRDGRRLERGWGPVPLPEAAPPLKPGGPVLVTGGFGGIGLSLARRLAVEAKAPLALLARRPLPPRADWDRALRREDAETARRIRAVRELEALGVPVLPLAADVANLEEMREAVAEAERALGPLSGLIHAAGAIADAPMLGKDVAEAEDVLAPKVLGTQVLAELFPDGRLDWMVLCASTSAATAPAGQVDYLAANAWLDAWARSRAGGRTRVLAIDWGVWQGVGMAEGALAARRGRAPETDPVDLPLLDRIGRDADGHRLLTADWAPRDRWALDGHRTASGDALLPGTGVLELVAEAMAAQGEPFPFAVRDLTFLHPLRTPDGGTTRVRLTLRRSEAGYAMALESAPPGGGFGPNAESEVDLRPLPAPAPLDLAAIRARLDARPTGLTRLADGTLASGQEAHLRFGPRWRTLVEAAVGEGEGLATLRMPPQGPEGCVLHPGLLDLATGWAMALIPGYDGTRLWVPLSYAEVRVHAPLGPTVLSHVRLASGNAEAASFDVALADPGGRVLVEVRGLTLRRLDGALAFAAPPPPEATGPRPLSPAEERLARTVAQGIRPEEGAEAFLRALALGRAHVAVSSLPLPDLIREAGRQEAPRPARTFARAAEAAAVPPEGESEPRLAALFADLLGAGGIGAEDSFFDLGGHSLIAVRLFAQVRRLWGVDLPISALFEAPTVRALARLVEARGGRLPGQGAGAGGAEAASVTALPARAQPRFTHLVAMHPGEGGPRTPFFLVAGMFGNVLNLRHLAHLVGHDRPFYGLQARGLTGEEEPHRTIPEAAASMIAEMRQVHRHGPWMVGGFSGGGITAAEIAHQLRDAGEEVAAVVLLDTPLPQRRPLLRRDRMVMQWQELRRGGVAYPLRWAARRAAWEWGKLRGRAAQAPDEPAFHDAAIEAAFLDSVAAYPMRLWDGPLTLFRPPLRAHWDVGQGRIVSIERAYLTPDNDWGPWAPRMQVIEVPGDHDSMVLEPNVRVLAARLRRVIEAAERDRRPARREAAE